MDALAEILRIIKLDSAIYLNAEFSEPWCVASPKASALAPLLVSGGAHVIIYHLFCEGRAYFEMEGGERVALSAGDLVTKKQGIGGAVVFDTNELLKLYGAFRVIRYEDTDAVGDFGLQQTRVVRLFAQKLEK